MKDIKQLVSLDGLRVCATFAIFLYHAGILRQGTFPVTWFFMLTGFMMYYTKYPLSQYPDYRSWFGYVWKKIKEFYPIYFVTFLYAFVLEGMDFGKENLGRAVINLCMMQPFFKDFVYDFNSLSWYLSVTIFLYLIGYFLISIVKKFKQYIPIIMFIVIGVMIVLNVLLRLEYDLYIYSNPFYRILDCFLGMMIAEIFMTKNTSRIIPQATKVEILLAICFVVMYFVSLKTTAKPAYYTIFFCIAMYVFANGKGLLSRFLGNEKFVLISKYSFYFYMTHELVLKTTRLFIMDNGMNFYVRLFLVAGVAFVVTCFIAIIYRIITVRFEHKKHFN